MAIDLSKLNRKELLELQSQVNQALKDAELKAKQDARVAAEKAAAEFGFSLDDLGASGAGKKKTLGVAKYRNPKNPEETWTGRGRKPRWLNEAIAAGVDISDLEI